MHRAPWSGRIGRQAQGGHTCAGLVESFAEAAPEKGLQQIDIRCAFGHQHQTGCETPLNGTGSIYGGEEGQQCRDLLLGAGGGCCSGNPVEKGQAGFGVVSFLALACACLRSLAYK